MNWPTSQDYNEAIQNPASCFMDPGLKSGEVVVNAIGLPIPRSGSFADVYQVKGGDGKMWAVKCFTRQVAGLQERYARIDEHLTRSRLPFTVDFSFLSQGIRVGGQWFPLLKMEWVEGFTLNEFVRDNVGKPHYLHALTQMWGKLTAKLREANIAHADLQHGNVLLVPAATPNKLGLRLIDYDGMWLPSLADKHPGEVGHPNYQHPLRLKNRLFNSDVDRFPHLVIACALRATVIGGKAIWEQFDNGDNLLFREQDLSNPSRAVVFRTLWDLKDDALCTLLGRLALASQEPLTNVPWLDAVLLNSAGPRLSDDEEKRIVKMLGVRPHFTASEVLELPPDRRGKEFSDFKVVDEEDARKSAVREILTKLSEPAPVSRKKSQLPWLVGGSVVAVGLLAGIATFMFSSKKPQPAAPEIASVPLQPEQSKTEQPSAKKIASLVPQKVGKDVPKKEPSETENLPPLMPPPREKEDALNPPPIAKVAEKEPPPVVPDVPARKIWDVAGASMRDGLVFANDGAKLIAVPPGGPNLIVYNAADGKQMEQLTPVNGALEAITAGANDSVMLCDNDKKLICWDLAKRAQRVEFAKPLIHARAFTVAKKANEVLLGGPLGEIEVHLLSDGAKKRAYALPIKMPVASLDCSPDGKCIAAVVQSGELFCKTPKDDVFKVVSAVPGAARQCVVMSPDARHFLFLSDKQPIRIYETATCKAVHRLEGAKGDAIAASFVAGGEAVAGIFSDKTLRTWDVASGTGLQVIALASDPAALAVSPDGRLAAIGTSKSDSVQLFRLSGYAARMVADELIALLAVEVPKPKDPALVEKKKEPDPATEPLKISEALTDGISACHYSGDGKKIYAVTNKGFLHVLDASSLKEVGKPYEIGNSALVDLAPLRRSLVAERLYLLNERRHIRTFDIDRPTAKPIEIDTEKVVDPLGAANRYGVVPAPDGTYLFVFDRLGGKHVVWPLKSGLDPAPDFLSLGELVCIRAIGFSADGRFGFASGNNRVTVWEKRNGFNQTVRTFPIAIPFEWMVFSPEANLIVASDKTKIHAWPAFRDVKTWEQVDAHGPALTALGVAVPKSTALVTAGGDNTARVWDLRNGKEVMRWKFDKSPSALAVSPDGKFAAIAHQSSNEITLWKVPSLGKKP